MRIKVRGTEEGAAVDIIKPGNAGPESDSIVQSVSVSNGNELLVNIPKASEPADLEYGNVVSASGEPAPTPAPAAPGDVGGGNEGSAAQAATGDVPPKEGEGAEGGSNETAPVEEAPTTSAASEKPLYLVDGDTIPGGFSESGLETPDGKTLYHFDADVAGGATTGNADGVSVYAESAENDKPVVAAAPSEEASA